MNIEQLNTEVENVEQSSMPYMQVRATLALAEQVRRIADLLESIISADCGSKKSLDVFVER